jgi:protein gp37
MTMIDSKIEWTHHTCNPWSGCFKAHDGCLRCYAETLDRRELHGTGNGWGEVWAGAERYFASEAYMRAFVGLAKRAARRGVRERVFLASRSDFLELPSEPKSWPRNWTIQQIGAAMDRVRIVNAAMREQRSLTFDIIRQTTAPGFAEPHLANWHGRPGLDWLILSKRPENAMGLIPEDVRPLVWLGTSVSDQATYDDWGTRLMQQHGFRLRFLSVEPMTGPINLGLMGIAPQDWGYGYRSISDLINMVIVGGESGAGARECREEWVSDIVRQCLAAGVAVFVKQLGRIWAKKTKARTIKLKRDKDTGQMVPREVFDAKGSDPKNWPPGLLVRQFPSEVAR